MTKKTVLHLALRAFLEKNDARNAEEIYLKMLKINPEAAKKILALIRAGAR